MIANDVIAAARHELNDEDAGNYRWKDEPFFDALTEAQRRFYMLRSDVFLQADDTMASVVEVTSLDTPLPVHAAYKKPLVWFVSATILASDGDDAANEKRADGYMARALNALMGGVG